MSIITQTLNAFKSAGGFLRKPAAQPVRMWHLSEDDGDLCRIQREIANLSFTAYVQH